MGGTPGACSLENPPPQPDRSGPLGKCPARRRDEGGSQARVVSRHISCAVWWCSRTRGKRQTAPSSVLQRCYASGRPRSLPSRAIHQATDGPESDERARNIGHICRFRVRRPLSGPSVAFGGRRAGREPRRHARLVFGSSFHIRAADTHTRTEVAHRRGHDPCICGPLAAAPHPPGGCHTAGGPHSPGPSEACRPGVARTALPEGPPAGLLENHKVVAAKAIHERPDRSGAVHFGGAGRIG